MTRDLLHESFADWHADFHELLANSDGDLLPRRSLHCRWNIDGRALAA